MKTGGAAVHVLRPHVAMLQSPGMGHLIPMVALARSLVAQHGFEVTLFLTERNPKAEAYVRALPEGIHVNVLPPPDLSDVPAASNIVTIICLTVVRSIPALRSALKQIPGLAVLIVDLFGTEAFDAAREANVAPYVFHAPNATVLSLLLHLPELDRRVQGPYRDMPEPLRLPGCVPLEGRDLIEPVQDRENVCYWWIRNQCARYPLAEGIIVNTFKGMESGPLKALQEEPLSPQRPPIYAVGPLVLGPTDVATVSDECPYLRWLDEQPARSVLYVSHGSGGTLSAEQLEELAAGLEMSSQRFLWVVRSPSSAAADGAYLDSNQGSVGTNDPLWFMPHGFLERTKGVGLVVPSWAPQVAVLAHESTGGFLTHCGWNSVLEAAVHGVPLIAWPLYAEQRLNAVMLVQDVGNGIRPIADQVGMVRREEVCRVVRALMVGQEGIRARNTAKNVQEAAGIALSEAGLSTKALTEVANKWRAVAAAKDQ